LTLLQRCFDAILTPDVNGTSIPIVVEADCPLRERWVNAVFNFDNVFNSFMAIFVVVTCDGWTEVL